MRPKTPLVVWPRRASGALLVAELGQLLEQVALLVVEPRGVSTTTCT